MTQQEIHAIEEQLGLSVPQPYREAALSGRFKDPIHDDAKRIIGINRSFRLGDFGDANWNFSLLAFGHDGSGNYYCIDVEDFDAGVFLRDHETLAVQRAYESFSLFLKDWT